MKNQNPFAIYQQGKRHAELVASTYESIRNQRINEARVAKAMRPIELDAPVTASTLTPLEASNQLAKVTEKIISDSGGKLTWADWGVAAEMAAQHRPDLVQAQRPR
jgi:hypothetical protein